MRNIQSYHAKTVNNHLSSLRSLNEYLIEAGCQTEIVVLDSDFMKIQIQYASPCTVEQKEVEAFRQRLLEGGNKRDYAIVTLYTYSGIRRSECVNLRLDQVDLTAREIRVIGKGDKQRIVYINDKTVHAIREYLKVRNSDSPYLFVSRQSGKMNPSRINQIFNQYSDTITPKTLRHYSREGNEPKPSSLGLGDCSRHQIFHGFGIFDVCSHALETDYAIHELANQAGHSSVQTTMIYTNLTAKAMKEKANRL